MILTISSLKGGVGKTSTAIFLAQAMVNRGHRVLVVDLDHNNNLTDYFLRGASLDEIDGKNIREVLTGKAALPSAIWKLVLGPDMPMDIIPATPSLATIGIECASNPASVLRLRSALRKLDYDHVIIDTPPALTLELTAGLYAADMVIVPVSASRWTVQGYQVIASQIAGVEDAGIKMPRIVALPSMVTAMQAEVLQNVEIWDCLRSSIRRDVAIATAASEGRVLRAGTHADGWFDELAGEVVG